MPSSHLPTGYKLKPKYRCVCAKCGEEFSFAPSLLMRGGINGGHAACFACDEFLHVEIDLKSGEGISEIWDEYRKRTARPNSSDSLPGLEF